MRRVARCAMKIATWNINSLNMRLERLREWLRANAPDVACLQETKLEDAKFPADAFADIGYSVVFHGQKSYNGVAILARSGLDLVDVQPGIAGYEDEQKRVLAATVGDLRVICMYVPNGQAPGTDKYAYKLDWCRATAAHLREARARYPKLVVAGDFNVAPEDRDVHDPKLWEGQIHCSEPERAAFRGFLDVGLVDSFRLFDQPPNTFSWWDYRMLAFPKNRGLRIDHILLSRALQSRCVSCRIDRNARKGVKPSDHAPVVVELAE
jgi:exodeoxyribonuclease III